MNLVREVTLAEKIGYPLLLIILPMIFGVPLFLIPLEPPT